MSTLWRREEFLRICSKERLAEKAQDIEVTIPVKKSQETRYNLGLNPGSFFINPFWGRRPDGVAINEALKIVYIFEFKRSTDKDEGFLEVKDAEDNEQHKSIIDALKVAAPEWEFEQINLWWVTADQWLRATSTPSTKSLIYKKEKQDKLFTDHVTQVCKAHNCVIASFLQQVQGGTRSTAEGSRENIGHIVHV